MKFGPRRIIERIERINNLSLLTFLFFVGFLVYGNSLFNAFVWDDEEQIIKNPLIQNFSNLPQVFASSTFYGGGANPTGWFYRPIMTFSFLLNYSLWGKSAFGFHLFQVALHLINGALLFLFFLKLFAREKFLKPKLFAFLAALVFTVHPANVEAVAYIAATQECLYTFFALMVFLVLLNEKKNARQFLLAGLLALFSFLSKESSVFLIPLVSLFLLLFKRKRVFIWLLLSSSAFLTYLFLRLALAKIPLSSPNIGPIADAPLTTRMLNIPYEIFSYFRIIIFPKDLFISQHTLISDPSDFRFWGYLLIIVSLLFLFFFLLLKKRSRLLWFFTFWFFGSLGMVLNILPLDMSIAERWLYFPLMGFLGIMTVFLEEIFHLRPWLFYLIFYLILLVSLVLGARTIERNTNWRDGLTLYSHDIQLNPDAFDLQNNYGVELFRAGKIGEAKKHFERSIELYPKWWFAYNNLAVVYQRHGNLEKARELYEKTLKISDYYLTYENLALLKLQIEGPRKTLAFLDKALRKFPLNEVLNKTAAIAYLRNGEKDKARIYAERTLMINPSGENYQLFKEINSSR